MIYLAKYVCERCLSFGHLQLSVLYLWALISLLLSISASRWHHHATRSERIKQRRAGWLGFPWNSKRSQGSFSSPDNSIHVKWMLPAQGTSLSLQLSKTQIMTCFQHHVKFCWVLMWASLCRCTAQCHLSWLVLCCRPKIYLWCLTDTAKTIVTSKQISFLTARRWSQLF